MQRNIKEDYKRAYQIFRCSRHGSDDYYWPKKFQFHAENELIPLHPAAVGAAYLTWFMHSELIDKLQYRLSNSRHNWITCLGRKAFGPTKTYFLDLLKEKRDSKYYVATEIKYGDPKWKPSKQWSEKVTFLKNQIGK